MCLLVSTRFNFVLFFRNNNNYLNKINGIRGIFGFGSTLFVDQIKKVILMKLPELSEDDWRYFVLLRILGGNAFAVLPCANKNNDYSCIA